MPISQSRMLNLIKAIDAYASTHHTLTKFIADTATAIPPQPSADILLTALQNIQQFAALSAVPQHLLTIVAEEKAHFKLNAARNERHARRSKLKRQGLRPAQLPAQPAPPAQTEFIPLSDVQLARQGLDIGLAAHKLKINQDWEALGQRAPFPDIYNDEPLTLDHKIHLGLAKPEDFDTDLF